MGTWAAEPRRERTNLQVVVRGLAYAEPDATVLGPPSRAMAKPKKKKEIVFLVCEETGDRNYTIMKKPGTTKLELSKYSPRLRRHTKHVEKKK